ncbi:MAG TPA: hypothetical protein VGB42_11625 [Candidatus Thermoplasmatota archaeon]
MPTRVVVTLRFADRATAAAVAAAVGARGPGGAPAGTRARGCVVRFEAAGPSAAAVRRDTDDFLSRAAAAQKAAGGTGRRPR